MYSSPTVRCFCFILSYCCQRRNSVFQPECEFCVYCVYAPLNLLLSEDLCVAVWQQPEQLELSGSKISAETQVGEQHWQNKEDGSEVTHFLKAQNILLFEGNLWPSFPFLVVLNELLPTKTASGSSGCSLPLSLSLFRSWSLKGSLLKMTVTLLLSIKKCPQGGKRQFTFVSESLE